MQDFNVLIKLKCSHWQDHRHEKNRLWCKSSWTHSNLIKASKSLWDSKISENRRGFGVDGLILLFERLMLLFLPQWILTREENFFNFSLLDQPFTQSAKKNLTSRAMIDNERWRLRWCLQAGVHFLPLAVGRYQNTKTQVDFCAENCGFISIISVSGKLRVRTVH